jgi:hypothetical protein
MKRITFITGYFGSGKTEVALNLAFQKRVQTLIDLDIVNPYFRSREQETAMNQAGIRVISSGVPNGRYVDLPYVAKEAFLPFWDRSLSAVYDLGGSGSGARLLRQFKDYLPDPDVDLLFCVNMYREETDSADKIIQEIHHIEEAGGMRPTGLINNTNLLKDTTYEQILEGEHLLRAVGEKTGLPIVYTGVVPSLAGTDQPVSGEKLILNLFFNKHWH